MKFREAVTHLIAEGVRAVTPPVVEWTHRTTLDGKPVPSLLQAIFGDLFAELSPGRRGEMYELDVEDINIKALSVIVAAMCAVAQQLGIKLEELNLITYKSWVGASQVALSKLYVDGFTRAAREIGQAFRASREPAPEHCAPRSGRIDGSRLTVGGADPAMVQRLLSGAHVDAKLTTIAGETVEAILTQRASKTTAGPPDVPAADLARALVDLESARAECDRLRATVGAPAQNLAEVIRERDEARALVRKYAAGTRYHWAAEEQARVAEICAMAPGAPEFKSHADCKSAEDCERRFPTGKAGGK